MPRPTSVQETAIRSAIDNNRIGDAADYAERTLTTMTRNGWLTFPGDGTYRITGNAARDLGLIVLGERYDREDALATNPTAQRQQLLTDQAAAAGYRVIAPIDHDMILVDLDTFAALLARAERSV